MTDFSPKSLKDLSETLASGNGEVLNLCARIGFSTNSLEPLKKLQAHGFTPEAILQLHEETCDYDTDLMIRTIQALE